MTYPLSQTPGAHRQRAWRTKRGDNQFTEDASIEASSQADTGMALIDHVDLARPARPCSCCKREFQPSVTRRMLCAKCYSRASPRDESGVVPCYQ